MLFVAAGLIAIAGGPSPCLALEGPPYSSLVQTSETGAQNETSQSGKNGEGESPETPDVVLVHIQSTVDAVSVPEIQKLAEALGVPANPPGGTSSAPAESSLEELGDLNGDGIPEVALKWLLPELAEQNSEDGAGARKSWRLFLLAWDGQKWKASPLGSAAEELRFEVIRLGKRGGPGITVVVTEGRDAIPYPAVYQINGHVANLVWDGRADESRYEGYPHGRVEFHDVAATDVTEMTAFGRADPGLLSFPKESRRGFEVQSSYRWEGQGFVPVKTNYSPTPDYTLYRFVAALHLHDFRGAYALIDPSKFLNTDNPTLDKFRQLVESSWPEFLDDNVFEALDAAPGTPDAYAFILGEQDKKFVYHPTFTEGERLLLSGLERHEQK